MKNELQIRADAKVNLFLEVTGKRDDGYHELSTVMHTVSLCDYLTVSYDGAGSGITLLSSKKTLPADDSNIAVRAARIFLEHTGKKGSVHISLSKKIPIAAGLGGGSADGAAVLRALNRLTDARLSTEELCALSAEIGADLPFLVRGGCVLAEGIGEKHTVLPPIEGLPLVIAIGARGSSTPAAYRALDEAGYTARRMPERTLEAIKKGDNKAICSSLYNAFEEVILPINEDARRLRARFADFNAPALMSGSGASVFGLFESEKEAFRVCAELRKEGFFAVTAQFTSR